MTGGAEAVPFDGVGAVGERVAADEVAERAFEAPGEILGWAGHGLTGLQRLIRPDDTRYGGIGRLLARV